MKFNNSFLLRTVGLLGTSLMRTWIGTIDFKWAYYDPRIDANVAKRHYILMFWHENILGPLFFRRHCSVTMLLSQHGDAELVSQAARLNGMKCVRGSTSHGSSMAIKEFVHLKEHDILAFTPDGPQGPYRHLAPGAIFLASKLQMPIVLVGVGHDRPWRMPSWDRFVLPRPFSRARFISSPMIPIPKRLTKGDLEHFRLKCETLLTQLTDEAEAWATSGDSMQGECIACMGPKTSLMNYGISKPAMAKVMSEPQS